MRNGGGIGDATRADIGNFMITHIFFFLIVTIAMLNIIFGIIIDTFSSLRADKNERLRDTTEVCFVCGKSKQTFDRMANSPDGFKNHIKEDHNMWSYLNFIFFIWEQDKDDDDGLEYYVRHKIEANEITWFPINKAMRLDQGESDAEALRKSILEDIQATEKSVFDRMTAIQTDVDGFLDKFSSALKQDFSGTTVKLGISSYLKGLEVFEGGDDAAAAAAVVYAPASPRVESGEDADESLAVAKGEEAGAMMGSTAEPDADQGRVVDEPGSEDEQGFDD